MSELQFTTVDRIFSKLHREIKGTDLNETDVIEYIGEALDHLKVAQSQEQKVMFIDVKDHHAEIPSGFQMVLQIARDNMYGADSDDFGSIIISSLAQEEDTGDCEWCKLLEEEAFNYSVQMDLTMGYSFWVKSNVFKERFTPVRLANSTLFNSLVCKEKGMNYMECEDEYTIVGTECKRLRFSFPEGRIALAYLKTAIDEETGYPLVPDEISHITAITYYVKWKIAEWYQWNRREGFDNITNDNERKWIKYARQAKNGVKMPKSIDDYQDLLEQTHQLIPKHRKYYGFFGNLSREQNLNIKSM